MASGQNLKNNLIKNEKEIQPCPGAPLITTQHVIDSDTDPDLRQHEPAALVSRYVSL